MMMFSGSNRSGAVRPGALWFGSPSVHRWCFLVLICLLALGSWTQTQAATGRTGGGAPSDLTKKSPYLIYPGDNTEMEVLWQLTATATSTIEWGPDTTYSSG